MPLSKDTLIKRIAVANRSIPADLVVKNGRIINIFTLDVIQGDIAIVDGAIAGIGRYDGREVIDAENRYICPAFIDAHVHIESSMVAPSEFAKVVLPHGVTTVIADPHEIANVAGTLGIQFMLDNSENLPLDIFYMMPSCVPATPFENAGAILKAEDIEPFFSHTKVLGLGEVMDFPSVNRADHAMLDKLEAAIRNRALIDGHAAGLDATAINVYLAAGIRTDHECTTASDALDRLRRGMYLQIREGTVAKNLSTLLPIINGGNARRSLFCTDDKHLDNLIAEGSIDHSVRLAIREGMDPLLAIQIASLNAAECYGLSGKGAIAPGYEADFLLLDSLEEITIHHVYKSGKLVAEQGKFIGDPQPVAPAQAPASLKNSVHLPSLSEEDLKISVSENSQVHVIGIIPNSLNTRKLIEHVPSVDGLFTPSLQYDLLKIAAVERHKKTGNIGLGIVRGFGLKHGAIASTVSHDSHNIVATGTNDRDILKAICTLESLHGGLAVVKDGKVLASLPLPIAGLLSDKDSQTVNLQLGQLSSALKHLGFEGDFNPFLTLSFLCLPVIPEIKLTDLGLFDVKSFTHIPIRV